MEEDMKKAGATALDQRLEHILTRERLISFQLWQVLLAIVIALPLIDLFGALAIKGAEPDANRLERRIHALAEAPHAARRIIVDAITGYSPRLARGQRFDGQAGLTTRPGAAPAGMLILLSRYDGDEKRGVIDLVDPEAGAVLKTIRPDVEAINARSTLPEKILHLKRDYGLSRYMEHHPFALGDGSIIFHGMGSPLVRIDACSRILWTLDGDFHHSIERDADGDFWTVSTLHPPSIPFVARNFDDDAIAKFSANGDLLYQKSVSKIMIDAGLDHVVYSHDEYDRDPVHLNDVQPVIDDGPYWKKGDLFLSLRNPSMIALYRPSTNKVLWRRQGPWLMQHDVDIISNHEIAVFNNNTVAAPEGGKTVGSNNIIIYDFATGATREPFSAGFEKNNIRTVTNGLFRFLPDASVMVEEHDYGRLLALGPDGDIRWSYVNRAAKDGRVFQLGWSRAITGEAAAAARAALAGADCSGR